MRICGKEDPAPSGCRGRDAAIHDACKMGPHQQFCHLPYARVCAPEVYCEQSIPGRRIFQASPRTALRSDAFFRDGSAASRLGGSVDEMKSLELPPESSSPASPANHLAASQGISPISPIAARSFLAPRDWETAQTCDCDDRQTRAIGQPVVEKHRLRGSMR